MPSKIETSLTPEQLQDFFKRCAQIKGSKLRDIQALADEFGIEISLMSARSFRQGAFSEYLEELKAKREMAESVSAIAKSGLSLTDAAASVLSQKLFDRLLNAGDLSDDESDQLSLSLSRLRLGDQRATKLTADLQLRDEQIAKLTADREERERKKTELLTRIEGAKKKGGLTKETLAQIEQEAKLL
jgi:hypothetical protein